MKRRKFLSFTAATVLVPLAARAELKSTRYQPGVVDDLLAADKTVFIDFYTSWCSTCRSQQRTIAALRAENPVYDQNMVFVNVDWDIYAQSSLAIFHKIPRRSTLLVLRGDEELGRIVAGTGRAEIKALMDAGIASA